MLGRVLRAGRAHHVLRCIRWARDLWAFTARRIVGAGVDQAREPLTSTAPVLPRGEYCISTAVFRRLIAGRVQFAAKDVRQFAGVFGVNYDLQ